MSEPASSATTHAGAYRERLTVPLRWWVQATMLLATFWLAFVVALPWWIAWLATALLTGVTFGGFLMMGAARTEVREGMLYAGGARISLALIGGAEALDKSQTRAIHGVDADARAFLLTRPYLTRAVKVTIDDPADPTPYWLISSRHPKRLAAALSEGSARLNG